MPSSPLNAIFNEDNSLQDTAEVLERALTLRTDPPASYEDGFDAMWDKCAQLPLFWMGVDIMSGGQQRETYTDDTAYYVLSTREHVIDAEKKIAPARSAYVDSLGYRLGRPRHIVDVRENYAGAVAETIEDFRRNTLLHTLVEAGLSTLSPSMSKLAIGNVSSTSWNLLDWSAAASLLLGIEGDALARDTVTLLANDDQLS